MAMSANRAIGNPRLASNQLYAGPDQMRKENLLFWDEDV
jgi:hypothetical protein